MNIFFKKLIVNYPYAIAIILFATGALIVLNKTNLFKKLIGINIMESSIFIMFVGGGCIRGGAVPIVHDSAPSLGYINPLPSALMLTGIVVSVSVTAFALALIIKLYKAYGTTDSKKIIEMRNEGIKQ